MSFDNLSHTHKERWIIKQELTFTEIIFLFADLNECSPNPCRNGGICVDGEGDFKCECPAGWTGRLRAGQEKNIVVGSHKSI